MRRNESRVPLITFAACVVVAFIAFAVYAVHRQQLADQRYDRQRDAICKVLASLPGQHPFPTLDRLRAVEARPGHPHDCQPLSSPPTPTPTPTRGRSMTAVVLVPVPASPEPAVSPAPSRTASPHPTPTRSPSPHPTPSPTCGLHDLLTDPTSCLHL